MLTEKEVAGDEFYVAVQVDLLAKLVSKMTCDNITLEVTDNALEVSGNGKYQIELDLEDDGSLVKLPNPIETFTEPTKVGSTNSQVIMQTLASIKPALAKTEEFPWFTCYYVGDNITATDTYTVADSKNGFLKEPKLISSAVMDLIGLFSGDVDIYIHGDKMLFDMDNGAVYGVIPSGVEHYSIEDIKALVSQEFGSSCTVVKSALLSLLDRIALFVGTYDNGKITLSFGENGLEVTSKYASEIIPYVKSENAEEFVCQTDINTLAVQVKAQTGSEITIEYGEDNAIKMTDGNITIIVALLEDDTTED